MIIVQCVFNILQSAAVTLPEQEMDKTLRFNIKKTTKVTERALGDFISSPIDDNLTSVPCIGTATVRKLNDAGVHSTTQLLGCFLTYKHPSLTVQEHCDAFYAFLRQAGITSTAAAVTLCVAEKANSMIPGIFNAEHVEFGDTEE